ncbi:MAG TPA: class I SAM-dependent methyltransferase [Vicinamibacterales bacterium]|nr:class I SAM-dependent methyltransferase [Vicinamibacterales bacterium]
MRAYDDLAEWWPLFSPPSHYVDEAEDLLQRLGPLPPSGAATMLELGSGGGSLAFHLKPYFKLTLTDVSEDMLTQNRAVNPEAEFVAGDMRTLRLGRQFEHVLVHDAVCYMTTRDDLAAAIRTAAIHCRPGGTVVFLPDYVKETFTPGTEHGGEDGQDGRAFRYLEWCWDPDPSDDTYLVDYAFLLREPGGEARVVHDRHVEGLFPRQTWRELFAEAGLDVAIQVDGFGRDIFIARPRMGRTGVGP